ncbi:MAG: hypothetical protein IPP77_05420 [Bacteroidetes bacterium]|nr:hypothetical protein [Bacteroidota bacterium]
MQLPKYPLKAEKSLMVFEFISEGPKGQIPKLVKYSETNLKGFYNLAFGDKNHLTGEIDDTVISNNNDSEKVLVTVIATLYAFTQKYPDVYVLATSSTKSRTRLYRMGIAKYLEEVKKDYEVYGLRNAEWEPFSRNTEYEGFIAKRKEKS